MPTRLTWMTPPSPGAEPVSAQTTPYCSPGAASRGTDTVTSYIVHWGDGSSDTYTTNGRKSVLSYDAEARKETTTSPEGRITTTFYDAKGHPTRFEPGPGVAPITYEYDERGRLHRVAQGKRAYTLDYDARWGSRMVGSGPVAALIAARFNRAVKTFGLNRQERTTDP